MSEQKVKFKNANTVNLLKYACAASELGLPMAKRDQHKGEKGVVIVGMGSSIEDPASKDHIVKRYEEGYKICALKFTIRWLKEQLGVQPHFTAQMDPGRHQIDKTPIDTNVIYYLASTCHPLFYRWLLANKCDVRIFHSACGLANEQHIYHSLFEESATTIGGFTVGNRAVGLCDFMGFPHPIEMVGFEFGWRNGQDYYAKDVTDYLPIDNCFMTDHGALDGNEWHTRPDLLASAITVTYQQKAGLVKVIGDSIVNSLMDKPDEYLDQICTIGKE
jgi:hypothetical protein